MTPALENLPDLPRRARRPDARPQELIDAALDVFAEHGFAGARLEAIAAHAGVSKGTVYLYFASKEELFEAAVRQTLVDSIARGHATVRDYEGSTSELLRTVLHAWWHGVVRSKAAVLAKIMCAESGNFPRLARFYYDNVIDPGRRLQRRILERGIARGEFRPVALEHTVTFIIAPFLYLQAHQHSFARVLPDAALDGDGFLEAFVDHVLAALRPDAVRA
jgi:AcrR family transcriptional regulator